LDDEPVWRRPNESSNSIGNLLLHLVWQRPPVDHLGRRRREDARDRASEFAARGSAPKIELIEMAHATLDEADAVLAKIEDECAAANSDAPLQRGCRPQAYEVTVFDAIFHVRRAFQLSHRPDSFRRQNGWPRGKWIFTTIGV